MSVKIEWVKDGHLKATKQLVEADTDLLEFVTPVVRLDELRRWLHGQSEAIGNSFINCDEINAYRLALDHLLAELKEAQP